MGLFDSVTKAVKSAAKAVSKAVNTAAEAVADVVETAGNAVSDGLNALAKAAEDIPLVGGAVAGALSWAGGVVSAATGLVASAIKGAGAIIGGALSGAIKIVGGVINLDPGLIGEGLLDIVSGVAGAVLLVGGKAIALVQTATGLQALERRLTREEMALLRRVFWNSIALYNVRLVEGRAGLFGLNARPFTLGNTIYLKARNVSNEPQLLVHECTHVWQYQHLGASYASDAVGAQWFVENAYSWEAEIARGNREWTEFNLEAQAAFLEDIYTDGELLAVVFAGEKEGTAGGSGAAAPPKGNGVFYDADAVTTIGRFEFNGVDHTGRANRGVAVVRGANSMRPSVAFN